LLNPIALFRPPILLGPAIGVDNSAKSSANDSLLGEFAFKAANAFCYNFKIYRFIDGVLKNLNIVFRYVKMLKGVYHYQAFIIPLCS
jgi:hypothetical protein